MARQLAERAALVIVDFQKAIDDPKWGRRNNPRAEAQTARLLAAWRSAGWPVVHVQHLSREPDSPYRPGQPGCDFKPELTPGPGEIVVQKRVHNAFIETGLEAALRDRGIATLVVAGVLLHNSVDATVRMAADLGFDTWIAGDATASVDIVDLEGRRWPAEEVHALSLAQLSGEYAQITLTEGLLQAAQDLAGQGARDAQGALVVEEGCA
ncbi:cysteine hydrolase family protein [Pelagibius sp. 7325]|uniref:cysteine hydrolase family protein n=1 Tax=Pelagibius sp. 7325 TaxID=3131994 RepID=UPI0030EC9B31